MSAKDHESSGSAVQALYLKSIGRILQVTIISISSGSSRHDFTYLVLQIDICSAMEVPSSIHADF